MNATLVINDGNGFESDIWQDNSHFNQEDWKSAIEGMNDVLKEIYKETDHNPEKPVWEVIPDDKLYILGDVINMLSSIDIELKVNTVNTGKQKLTDGEFRLIGKLTYRTHIDQSFDIQGVTNKEEYWEDYDHDTEMSLEEGFKLLAESISYSFQHEGFSDEESKMLEEIIQKFVPEFKAIDPADD